MAFVTRGCGRVVFYDTLVGTRYVWWAGGIALALLYDFGGNWRLWPPCHTSGSLFPR